MVVISELQ